MVDFSSDIVMPNSGAALRTASTIHVGQHCYYSSSCSAAAAAAAVVVTHKLSYGADFVVVVVGGSGNIDHGGPAVDLCG